jgi:hypothetical protein
MLVTQSHTWVAVLLGVGLSAACNVPDDDLDRAGLVASGDVAALDDPPPVAVPVARVAQIAYVKASNTGEFDTFGYAVALSADGSTLAVGAPSEASAATGDGGDQADNSAGSSGAVYVFRRRGSKWIQQAYLKASNTGANDFFGYSVALSADGSTLAVGALYEGSATTGIDGDQADDSAPYAGAAYVFARTGTSWFQEAYVKASNTGVFDCFGYSVALSADGSTLAVGAPYEDSAARGIDGDQADDSASDAGAAYVFTRTGTRWSQEAYVKASNTDGGESFGASLALSSDGSTLAVGAYGENSAATGVGGDQSDNNMPGAGAVYVLTRSGTTWSQEAYVKASNTDESDGFGFSVALSGSGSTLAVGALRESSAATGVGGDQADDSTQWAGAAYVFARGDAAWSQEAYVKASNTDAYDNFGVGIALSCDGSTLAVSAPWEAGAATGVNGDQTDDSAGFAGAVYLFARGDTSWHPEVYVKASNTETNDYFGNSLALSDDGSVLAVGAPFEDSAATGIGGVQLDESAVDAGAAYVLHRRR